MFYNTFWKNYYIKNSFKRIFKVYNGTLNKQASRDVTGQKKMILHNNKKSGMTRDDSIIGKKHLNTFHLKKKQENSIYC